MGTKLTSATKQVIISSDQPTILIGERINPTEKKKLTEALRNSDIGVVCKEARAQVQAGTDVLGINVGALDIDEVALLPPVVQMAMDAIDVALRLDSASPTALQTALGVYRG